MRWIRSRYKRRKQRWMDSKFWALVHDHDWLQYHHEDPRLRAVSTKPRRWR